MSTTSLRKPLLLAAVALPMAMGLAACGSSDYYDERAAEADYLADRGEALEDAAITSKVAAMLTEDHRLDGSQIHVRTFGNVVHLTGYVSSHNDMLRAEDLALQVPGVRRVENGLAITP